MVRVPWECIGLCVLTYIMVHVSCQAPITAHVCLERINVRVITCSLPYLQEDRHFEEWKTSDCGVVLGLAALAAAVGYGVHGPMIDRFGVVFGLSTALGGCSLGAALIATARTQGAFVTGAVLIRFSYAAGWPSEMKALKLLVPEEFQGLAVSALGFASRGGAILGRSLFGVLLQSFTWRQIAWQAARVLLIVGGIAVLLIQGLVASAAKKAPSAVPKPVRGLRDLLQEPSVWLVTAAFSCLCHVQHADDFMPLLFQGLTKSKNATIWSCVYPGGGITAMVLNTWKGNLLQRRQREQLYVTSSVLAASLLTLLLFIPAGEADESIDRTIIAAVLLFFVAFCCAVPYYLVPNLFAFDLMGTECATLIGFFEMTSFSSMMPAHMVLLRIAGDWGWTWGVLQMALTTAGAAGFLALALPRWRGLIGLPRGVIEDGHVAGYTRFNSRGAQEKLH
ncbi:unnamed protein product [Symbiodinium natans]|uniref:Major facilitator superfamily (MFS) profile domain-containing protein n=1 Tax=Symbiodinium natans TaxID=878477 RepID=A0A812K4I0_9DINO|nr:unnamed protein product [Symbiodinium natans]